MNSGIKKDAKKLKLSFIGFLLALSAFILTTIGIEGYKESDQTNGIFWPYLVKFYSIFKNNQQTVSSMSETPLIPLNDENIIKILIFISLSFSLVAIATGLKAKTRNEYSLYYATSIISGLVSLIYSLKILFIIL